MNQPVHGSPENSLAVELDVDVRVTSLKAAALSCRPSLASAASSPFLMDSSDVYASMPAGLPLSRAQKHGLARRRARRRPRPRLAAAGQVHASRQRRRRRAAWRAHVGTYRSVLGFLASLVFMVGGDKRLLHHIFRPVREEIVGEEIDGGPATLVRVDAYMAPVLERWLDLLMNTPGAAMVAAARPTGTQDLC